jgi:hypothetical protein
MHSFLILSRNPEARQYLTQVYHASPFVLYYYVKVKNMKISTIIIVALVALIAVVPAAATSDETFGQVFNLDDVA